MRLASIAVFALAAPVVLAAQSTTSPARTTRVHTNSSGAVMAAPETVFVRGSVSGEVPTGNYVITGSRSSWISDTVWTNNGNMSGRMSPTGHAMPDDDRKNDLEATTDKAGNDVSNAAKKAGKDVSREARRTPNNLEKTAKKVGHGVGEAAKDVKKAVTGKP